MRKILLLLCIIDGFSIFSRAQSTRILNQDAMLGSMHDKGWFKDNIPFLEVPDQQIQDVYYYRWFSYYTNMKYVNADVGYIVTEFSEYVWWQSAFGAIPCSGSYHFYEGRWLKDRSIMDDLTRYWTTGAGDPASRNYSFWKALSLYERFMVQGDAEFLKSMYAPLLRNHYNWGNRFNAGIGLYRQEGVWDGMELSSTSLQSTEHTSGYRPTINAYMYGDMVALSKIATMAGDASTSQLFTDKATTLREKTNSLLWDESATFFKHKWCEEVPGDGAYPRNKYYPKESFVDAREVYAYTMWYTNCAYDDPKYSESWKYLFDGQSGFYAPYGPTTLERSHHLYRWDDNNCCHWNGMSWPFSSSATLTAMANVLNDYSNKGMVSKDRFVDMLQIYTRTHFKDGKPYVAEAHDPDVNVWTYDLHRSKHYNHSTYNDIIISGLIGVRPRPDNVLTLNPLVPDNWDYFLLEDLAYHGHLYTILFDRTGTRYGKGAGFSVFENGGLIFNQPTVGHVDIPIKPADADQNFGIYPKKNYAANVDTANNYFPHPSASFSFGPDSPYEAVDGYIRFDAEPKSRWTNYTSPNTSDWFQVDYGTERTINRIDLLFFDDRGNVQVPASYTLEYWDGGAWQQIPDQNRLDAGPVNDRNIVLFPSITTTKIRTVMQNGAAKLGLTEFETWYEYRNGPEITTSILPNAQVGTNYSSKLEVAGGTAPYSFTAVSNLPAGIELTENGEIEANAFAAGNYNLLIQVADSKGESSTKTVTLPAKQSSSFSGTPIAIPGIVELEDFDKGGNGLAYFDNTDGNSGNVYRPNESIDIFAIGGGGYGIGWNASGEWMQYTVEVEETCKYQVGFNYASWGEFVSIGLELDNEPVLDRWLVDGNNNWGTNINNYTTAIETVILPQGVHTLKFELQNTFGVDMNRLEFTKLECSSAEPEIIANSLEIAQTGLPYEDAISVFGGTGTLSYNAFSNLPEGLALSNDGTISGTPMVEGYFTFDVRVTDTDGHSDNETISITIINASPYNGSPQQIPGTIQFEHFDEGGNGISYYDNTAGNNGKTLRTDEDVDIFNFSNDQYGIGWANAGEWLQYTVQVEESALYRADFHLTTWTPYITFSLLVDNETAIHSLKLEGSGLYGTARENYSIVSKYLFLPQGEHRLKFELNECAAADMDKMVFTKIATSQGSGLIGTYCNGIEFNDTVAQRIDPTIQFNWQAGSPLEGMTVDEFSVRWTGEIEAPFDGEYTFTIHSDNGRKLWVNDQLLIDAWTDDWGIPYSGSFALQAGQRYPIVIEYFENNGGANITLEWESDSLSAMVIPTAYLYPTTTQNLSLISGWNLISLYVQPDDSAITHLFPNAVEVKTTASFWNANNPQQFNGFNTLTAGKGYLLFNDNLETVTVSGIIVETPQIEPLLKGWNLIGCPYSTPNTFENAFESELQTIKSIKNFDGLWDAGSIENTLQLIEPGKAYFILK